MIQTNYPLIGSSFALNIFLCSLSENSPATQGHVFNPYSSSIFFFFFFGQDIFYNEKALEFPPLGEKEECYSWQ